MIDEDDDMLVIFEYGYMLMIYASWSTSSSNALSA